jgi:hypothetical protein
MNRREAIALDPKKLSDSQARTLQVIAGSLLSALEDLEAMPRSQLDPNSNTPPMRTSQNFFVSGEPGSGKTTVHLTLQNLVTRRADIDDHRLTKVQELRQKKQRLLWLEALDLEPAAESTNFLAAVLVRIDAALTGNTREPGTTDRRPGLLENRDALQDLRHLENDIVLAWEGTVLQRAEHVDPEVFAQDVLRAERARLQVNRRLRNALSGIADVNGEKDTLYVLPVDDFYLRPASSLEFLRLLRMISVPQLFILVMGDLDVVGELFYLNMLGELVRLAGEDVSQYSLDQGYSLPARARALTSHALRKLIPLSQRSVLEAMDKLQALEFSPREGTNTLFGLLKKVNLELEPARVADSARPLDPATFADFLLLRNKDVEKGADSYTYSGLSILDLPPREVVDLWQTLANLLDEQPKRWWEAVLNRIIEHTLAALDAETYLDVADKKRCEEAIKGTPYYRRTFDADALRATADTRQARPISLEDGRMLTPSRHVSWILLPDWPDRKDDRNGRMDRLAPRSTAWFTVLYDLMAMSNSKDHRLEEDHLLTVEPFALDWVTVSQGSIVELKWLTPAWRSFRHFDALAFRWNKILDAMDDLRPPSADALLTWLTYNWLAETTEILIGEWDPDKPIEPTISDEMWQALSQHIDGLLAKISRPGLIGDYEVVRGWLLRLDIFLKEEFAIPRPCRLHVESPTLRTFWEENREAIESIRSDLSQLDDHTGLAEP